MIDTGERDKMSTSTSRRVKPTTKKACCIESILIPVLRARYCRFSFDFFCAEGARCEAILIANRSRPGIHRSWGCPQGNMEVCAILLEARKAAMHPRNSVNSYFIGLLLIGHKVSSWTCTMTWIPRQYIVYCDCRTRIEMHGLFPVWDSSITE